jgi:hypothetical protein
MVSARENPLHVKHSPLAVTVIADERTIRTSRGIAHCKSPFLAHQLSMFFAPARYRVVNLIYSCSEVVLQTTKHIIVYPGLCPYLELIALHPAF